MTGKLSHPPNKAFFWEMSRQAKGCISTKFKGVSRPRPKKLAISNPTLNSSFPLFLGDMHIKNEVINSPPARLAFTQGREVGVRVRFCRLDVDGVFKRGFRNLALGVGVGKGERGWGRIGDGVGEGLGEGLERGLGWGWGGVGEGLGEILAFHTSKTRFEKPHSHSLEKYLVPPPLGCPLFFSEPQCPRNKLRMLG